MNEQKNLLLAIVLSIAIVVIFQVFFPQQTMIIQEDDFQKGQTSLEQTTSIDQTQDSQTVKNKTREEILNQGDSGRILIKNDYLNGTINLEGGIIDDLVLTQYKESLDTEADNIKLFSPVGTKNPYYLETGWKQLSNNTNNIDLPNSKTKWLSSSNQLTPNSPVTLSWTNNQKITFNTHITIDDEYMFSITQEIINKSPNEINLFPYRFIKRINTPDTINF